ncbi:sensor histidine kinase [Catenulispora rubra]|uniref:sensor histidine kinase n=1 Tax=Catenulispora rubra TaxID=280293 RepID=UPI001892819A|nr:sensor domain-containing protein [Catenulispora rubra]
MPAKPLPLPPPPPPQSAEDAAAPEAPHIGFVAAALYLVASSVLWAVAFVGVSALMLLGVVLTVTPIGPWVLALAVAAARGFGVLYRGLVLRLFGERLEPPAERTERGALAWRRFMLGGDGGGWTEAAFLSVRLPIALLNLIVGVGLWFYGLLWVFWPLMRNWDDLYTREPDGTVRRGIHIFGFWFDTLQRSFLLTIAGLLTVALAAWTARKLVALDLRFYRVVLGSGRMAARVQQLERSRSYAVDDSAATLRRIERDLHDGAQARLVALGMQLVMLKDSLDGEAAGEAAGDARLEHSRGLVDQAQVTAKTAIAELRDLVRGIHPPTLDQGLETALRTLTANGPIPTVLTVRVPDPRPAAAIETMAYFCAAELLTNAAKHARATCATVTVEADGRHLMLRVTDDGRGGARMRPGGGLAGLADRVGTVDGTIEIESPAGGPTVVTVALPMKA